MKSNPDTFEQNVLPHYWAFRIVMFACNVLQVSSFNMIMNDQDFSLQTLCFIVTGPLRSTAGEAGKQCFQGNNKERQERK